MAAVNKLWSFPSFSRALCTSLSFRGDQHLHGAFASKVVFQGGIETLQFVTAMKKQLIQGR
jgi:hypothetical protein